MPAHPVIGQSPLFLETLDHVSRTAGLHRPVIIAGERGTGKELIADRLHYLSPRWDRPFLKVNCAALPEGLLESELFGHEAGAFTGADRRHIGRFERTEDGTLFLDEIASISLRLQEKLLRVIEYGEFERVGGSRTLHSTARIICAANRDLPAMARAGKFRADLLDRLAFDVITLPPLRKRPEDILLLADHFALGMTQELGRPFFPGFSQQAEDQMLAHHWPGNVRELKSAAERAVYHSNEGEIIHALHFDPFASPFRLSEQQETPAPVICRKDTPPAIPADFKQHIRSQEKLILQQAMRENRFHQKRTAEALGLSYHQLRGYLKKHGLLPRNSGKKTVSP
jgi:psp operon transcriptional activator